MVIGQLPKTPQKKASISFDDGAQNERYTTIRPGGVSNANDTQYTTANDSTMKPSNYATAGSGAFSDLNDTQYTTASGMSSPRRSPEGSPKRGGSKGGSPQRSSPERTSPERTSPERTSPERTSPDRPSSGRNTPAHTSPDRSPQRSPQRNSPLATSTPVKQSPSERTPPQSPSRKGSTANAENDQYVPTPYVFRAPARMKHLKRITAKCPPFYLQLDHTLAVIWALFSERVEVNLGIVQLQWASNFLKGIYTRKGEHPKDVALCIQAIEDLLLTKYAEMADDVATLEDYDRRRRMKTMMFMGSESSVRSKETVCESDTCFAKLSMEIDREMNEADVLVKEMPLSVNYMDMFHKSGIYSRMYSKQSKASTDLSVDLPQENAIEFLEQWRCDQIRKINAELRRLHSIEAYIGCAATNIEKINKPCNDNENNSRNQPFIP